MIFKSLHKKFLNKKIEKSITRLTLKNRIKQNPIKTISCIIDPAFSISVENLIDLAKSLNIKEKDLKIITFQQNKNIFNVFSSLNITPSCISFYGNLIGKDSLEFISFDCDLLINCFKDNKFLTLLSSQTNAEFRVGFESEDSRLNDLIFSQKINSYPNFKSELIKYLKMIK